MFESIQDYLGKKIDRDKLVENMTMCEEYLNASPDVKSKLDLFIEDIKDAKTEEDVINLLYTSTLYDLGIDADPLKLLDLATRTNGGAVPVLEPGQLAAFIDLCMENSDEERLFRLAYNYDTLLFDKTRIEDYYMRKNDIFYLNEMLCHGLTGINHERIINAVIGSNQLDELKYLATNIKDKSIDISKVLDKIKELDN